MNYLIALPLFIMLIYIMSFAKYNWKRKNRLAAVGSALIGVTAFALFLYTLFSGKFEL